MKTSLTRRDLLKGTMAAQAAALVGCASRRVGTAHPLQFENQHPGTTDWMLTKTRIDPKTKYRCPWIEGYSSHTSIRAGEELQIYVSTTPASKFALDIYRMGYYAGLGGRKM